MTGQHLTTTVVTPENGAQLAEALRAAAQARQATVISGGGTKLGWGRPPATVDLLISTSKLVSVTHRYGDLTATIGAGATLAAVNQELASHGQWLPIDSAFSGATIGGIVATNDAGPLRHRFGTPRDRVLGVTLALTDGRVAKAGGTVVKNVAGYDLSRLVSGSFGTLAAIESVTMKVEPLPAASGTLVRPYADHQALCGTAQALMDSPLELTALDVRARFALGDAAADLLVRVASSPVATEAQLSAAAALVGGSEGVLREGAEAEVWRSQIDSPWEESAAVVRLSWRPADLSRVLALLEDTHRQIEAPLTLTGRIAVGAGIVRIDGDASAQVRAIETWRASALLGHVVVLRADLAVKQRVDVWGPMGDSMRVVAAIKQKLDPAGILNAGRGPV